MNILYTCNKLRDILNKVKYLTKKSSRIKNLGVAMDKFKQQKVCIEIGISKPLKSESDYDYACRIIEEATTFLIKYSEQIGKKGFVCHLSGGVDSFVTSMLIKKAGLYLINLSLPFGVKQDMEDVEKSIDIIKPDVFRTYDITGPVIECIELLRDLPSTNVDIGNTKSRTRMIILYRVAEVYDILVAGSTNATELTLGMVTKYGDNASDVQPLAGITKGIIYEMAKIFGAPQSILDKMPKTGMWDNESNKKDVEDLNHQVCLYLRGEDISEEFELKIVGLYEKSEHKRKAPVTQEDCWWNK